MPCLTTQKSGGISHPATNTSILILSAFFDHTLKIFGTNFMNSNSRGKILLFEQF